MSMLYSYAELPRTGLGNMLFPWARSIIFAYHNKCPIIAPQWVKINRIGPWLRGERDKRYYFAQFTNTGYIQGLRRRLILWVSKRIDEGEYYDGRCGVCVFSGMRGYFKDICNYRDVVRNEIARISAPKIREALDLLPNEFIGVHVRRGDFTTIGLTQQEGYYLHAIEKANELAGRVMPVLVFSDGRQEELRYFLKFENVRLMPPASALQDLLSLARSKVLVATNNSTFSAWANFLGGMKSVWSKDGEPPDAIFDSVLV